VRIEPLTEEHDFSQFDCGKESLNKYLKFAFQARRMGLSRTFVAVEDNDTVVGYYTRVPNSVKGEALPSSGSKNPVPVMLLAKFAVDANQQRAGIGKMLLKHFLQSVIDYAENEACFAIIVDALDEDAKEYYVQFGFKETPDKPMRLFLPMKTVRKLIAA
jgi:predicted N-acetyltransferase YhbS